MGHILASLSDNPPFTEQISLPSDTADAMSLLITTPDDGLADVWGERIGHLRFLNAFSVPKRWICGSFPPPEIRSATGVCDALFRAHLISAFDMGEPIWVSEILLGIPIVGPMGQNKMFDTKPCEKNPSVNLEINRFY